MDAFTALPIQIFNWASRPQEDFHQLAAAGIIVLLATLLLMNATAVWIRQRAGEEWPMNTQTQPDARISSTEPTRSVLDVIDVTIRYGVKPAIRQVSLSIPQHRITAIIGPSGLWQEHSAAGLQSDERLHSRRGAWRDRSSIWVRTFMPVTSIPVEVRRRIGMVFQKPNPFPKSILQNVAWGLSINGYSGSLEARVEQSLRRAALWEEVSDRLHESAWHSPEGSSKDSALPEPWLGDGRHPDG